MNVPIWFWTGLGRGLRWSAYVVSFIWSVLFMVNNTGVEVVSFQMVMQCLAVDLIWFCLIFRFIWTRLS